MNKTTIITIVSIVAIAGAVYFYFMGHSTASDVGTLEEQTDPEIQASAARVLVLLNQINSIKIDTKFFSSPEYQTLRDFSIAIPTLPVGRPNPFAPLPGSVVPAPAPTATRVPSSRR